MEKYTIKTTLLLLVMAMLSSACKKQTAPLPPPLSVVESYLLPGKPALVKITREIQYGSRDTLRPVSGLQVKISHGGTTEMMTETGPGIYQLLGSNVIAGAAYRLTFQYDGKEISAETAVPLKPGPITASASEIVVPQIGPGMKIPDPIVFQWPNPEKTYHLMVVKNMEADPQPITFGTGSDAVQKPERSFRIAPTNGSQQQLALGRFSYYGRHAVIVYRIQPEYAALYEDSGSSSVSITTAPTNIRNGLGIFTGVHPADTVWVRVR